MSDVILDGFDGPAVPVQALTEAETGPVLDTMPAGPRAFVAMSEFKGKAGQVLLVPGAEGVSQVLFGVGAGGDPMALRTLAGKLPGGTFRIARAPPGMSEAQNG